MRGIDVVDQQCGEYIVQLSTHKWWHRLLLWTLVSATLNSYLLYRADCKNAGVSIFSQVFWHYTLAMHLLGPYLPGGHIQRRHGHLAPPGFHQIKGHCSARRACVVCRKVTRRFCGGCAGKFMCDGPCYIAVHTQPGYLAGRRRA
ncbi:hypothetical protein M758_UG261700 [Ceratodon purpureus]|nr:hypothetical protein M758_UG261700 [Ceratodon purpureus]